eukprot:5543752-Alexandrium_andersonii.AAC.1
MPLDSSLVRQAPSDIFNTPLGVCIFKNCSCLAMRQEGHQVIDMVKGFFQRVFAHLPCVRKAFMDAGMVLKAEMPKEVMAALKLLHARRHPLVESRIMQKLPAFLASQLEAQQARAHVGCSTQPAGC